MLFNLTYIALALVWGYRVGASPIQNLPIESIGWLGADGAYSQQIGPCKRLWFFGDTFVGKIIQNQRTQ